MTDQNFIPKICFSNDAASEWVQRDSDPKFARAMNAFWRTYHTETEELWRCVTAALDTTTRE